MQPVYQDVAGLKRHLSSISNDIPYAELKKKVKTEVLIKVEESEAVKKTFLPEIPPLSLPQTNSNMYLDYLKPLALLNQSNLLQKYIQLLTLNHLAGMAQQQRSVLNLKRDDSASTCSSYSSNTSFSSPTKVPILLTKPSEVSSIEIPKFIDSTISKKSSKVSACKNYIALLCTGFARSILTADPTSEIIEYLNQVIQRKKVKYSSLEGKSVQELREFILEHIHKDICGKKVKKTNKGRDFKVRNTEELEFLLTPKEGDNEVLYFRKETLKEMIDFFFTSNCYYDWLEKGMINEANRHFFLKNKLEIQKKFSNPTLYKPHFDYHSQ